MSNRIDPNHPALWGKQAYMKPNNTATAMTDRELGNVIDMLRARLYRKVPRTIAEAQLQRYGMEALDWIKTDDASHHERPSCTP